MALKNYLWEPIMKLPDHWRVNGVATDDDGNTVYVVAILETMEDVIAWQASLQPEGRA